MFQELTEIFREVFNDPALTVTPETSPENFPRWNSLHHINLVLMAELHFGIKFRMSEVEEATSVGMLAEIIAAKLN